MVKIKMTPMIISRVWFEKFFIDWLFAAVDILYGVSLNNMINSVMAPVGFLFLFSFGVKEAT